MIRILAAVALAGATVYTSEGPPLQDATVLIEGNRVAAVGRDVPLPEGTRVLDLDGAIVTPGLIDPASRLGVTEVVREASTVEGTAGPEYDPIRAALRVEDTFNPDSFVVPVARVGGLTSAVIVPSGGLVSGQSIWVDLVEREPVRRASLALHVSLRGGKNGRGARARAFLRLREVFDDARLFRSNRGPYISRKLRELSLSASDLDALARALDREMLVVFEVDRAADIQAVLEIVREHKLRAVLLGVAEGWRVAEEIVAAGVPVLVDPLQNLPHSFDMLHSREDNALRLHRAGVRVAFTLRHQAHRAHRLRFAAGNAVASGFPYEAALAAITRVPAEIFGMVDAGSIKPGALANIVVWNGDPFEVTSWPTRAFIRGEPVDLRSRQDLLTERYLRQP
jgi:imidazolonepropionase-like amidohydrolase